MATVPDVVFHFDPACPWTWMTSPAGWSTWPRQRDLDVAWQPLSLKVLNGDKMPEQYRPRTDATFLALRAVTALADDGDHEAAGRLYTALGDRLLPQGRRPDPGGRSRRSSVAAAPQAADALDDDSRDDGDRRAHDVDRRGRRRRRRLAGALVPGERRRDPRPDREPGTDRRRGRSASGTRSARRSPSRASTSSSAAGAVARRSWRAEPVAHHGGRGRSSRVRRWPAWPARRGRRRGASRSGPCRTTARTRRGRPPRPAARRRCCAPWRGWRTGRTRTSGRRSRR